jgi:NAD(P)-dependent dehydrogenase (short-subunit alcohol dehydrogenase family)
MSVKDRYYKGEYPAWTGVGVTALATALEREVANAKGYPCDVTDEKQLDSAIDAIRRDLGTPTVLIHNAVGGVFGNFLEIDPQVLSQNFQVNTMALLYLARRPRRKICHAGPKCFRSRRSLPVRQLSSREQGASTPSTSSSRLASASRPSPTWTRTR